MTDTTLKIEGVTQETADPTRFVLRFNRTLTQYERSTVPGLISDNFLPAEVTGPDAVTLNHGRKAYFTDAKLREKLKGIVDDAESLALMQLIQQQSAEGHAAAEAEETRRELEAIDWDADDSEA